MEDKKKEFNIGIALSNTQSAAFQRANVYRKGLLDKDKEPFINEFRRRLRRFEFSYTEEPEEEKHVYFIESFKLNLSHKFHDILTDGRLRFGVAQKAVNLYLKFLWCLGYLPFQPLHCPVDRIILNAVGIEENWTQLDSSERYNQIIEIIREEARKHKQSIAEWELNLWSKSV